MEDKDRKPQGGREGERPGVQGEGAEESMSVGRDRSHKDVRGER